MTRAGLVVVALMPAVAAASATGISVESARGEYTVRLEASFNAPPEAVWRVITDYDNLSRISPTIRESGRVEHDGDELLVDTVTRACYAFFCRTLKHRQQLHETPHTEIVAETVPEASDFSSGVARWKLARTGDGGTRLEYEMKVRPAVFVPPLIGPAFVRRSLERETRALLEGIEREAVE